MQRIISPASVKRFFGARYPILQAGMGGVAQPQLVAATCAAGGFGILGLYRHSVLEIGQLLDQTCALTDARFGVNFVPFVLDTGQLLERVQYVSQRPERPIVTFFGLPASELLTALPTDLEWGVQVGSVEDLRTAFTAGAQFGVLQTAEAGGHHLGELTQAEALAQAQQLSLTRHMVFLSGGVGDATALRTIVAHGYAGVLCGTVFAATRESAAHPRYKQAIVKAQPQDTLLTDRFSVGWHTHRHRVIRNRSCDGSLSARVIGYTHYFGKRYPILRYSVAVPTVHTEGQVDEMALYCGNSCSHVQAVRTVQQVIDAMTTF